MSFEVSIQVRTRLQDEEPIGSDTQCVTLTPSQFRRFFSRPEMLGVVSFEDLSRVASLCIINGAVASISVFYTQNEASVFNEIREWSHAEDFGSRLDTLTRPAPGHVSAKPGAWTPVQPDPDARSGLDIADDDTRKDYWDKRYGTQSEPARRIPIVVRGTYQGLTVIQGSRP